MAAQMSCRVQPTTYPTWIKPRIGPLVGPPKRSLLARLTALAWLDDLGQIDALLKANEIPEDERWPQIEEAITRAGTILEPHRDKALKLIDLLVEHSRVDGPEFARLMDGGPN
jgi:hypothetical protein